MNDDVTEILSSVERSFEQMIIRAEEISFGVKRTQELKEAKIALSSMKNLMQRKMRKNVNKDFFVSHWGGFHV